MLVFVKENYSEVPSNTEYWVKTCEDESSAPEVIPAPTQTEFQKETQIPSTPKSQEPLLGGSGFWVLKKKGVLHRQHHVHQVNVQKKSPKFYTL